MIPRLNYKDIQAALFSGRVIVLYGARQVGKTTLCKELIKSIPNSLYMTCDDPEVRAAFTNRSVREMQRFIGQVPLVVLDEVQRLGDPGLTLKLLHDADPSIQIVATGSSAFEIASSVQEPLTGRKTEFHLYPFTMQELSTAYGFREISASLENRMIFGSYPSIVLAPDREKENYLYEITQSYLFKDVLALDNIKNPEKLQTLLTALALQIGNEVSYNELAVLVGLDKNTVERYLRILEQAFIVFRLNPFSRNHRNDLTKNRKIYFWDTGIRNALIKNLNMPESRTDTGPLWENFILAERIKYLRSVRDMRNSWFWRAAKPATGEVDYIEDYAGKLTAYEIKWRKSKVRLPKAFEDNYKELLSGDLSIVNRDTWADFLGVS